MTPHSVIKLGGRAIEHPHDNRPLWNALARLHRDHPIVIVHGGGGEVDRLLLRLGIATEKRDGIRITPHDAISHVTAVLAGSVNKALTGALIAAGAPAVGLCLGDGNAASARVDDSLPFDPGRVGRVHRTDPALLHTLLDAGFLPVIACIAFDDAGMPLNINADDAAVAVASALHPRRLVLLTDVPGVQDHAGTTLPRLDPDSIEDLIARGVIRDGMAVKTRAAARAAARIGSPVLIASWHDPDALLLPQPPGTTVLPAPCANSERNQP